MEETNTGMQQLLDMDAKEVGQLVHNAKAGPKVLSLARKLPKLNVRNSKFSNYIID